MLPEYVVKLTDREVVLRNYAGKLYRYKMPSDGKTPARPRRRTPAWEPVLVG